MDRNEKFMRIALKEAQKAFLLNEVPVGCVIVKDDKIIARGHNLRENNVDVSAHAEIVTLRKANKKLEDWQLVDCEIFVTLEPCLMCAGAILQSHISNVYFGCIDVKNGAFGGKINVLEIKDLNHYPKVYQGILQIECCEIIKTFFKQRRKNK